MIRTDAGLRATHDALLNLQVALRGLYEERAKHGTAGYRILGEGIVDEIFKLRKEIDDLIGLTAYVAEFGETPQAAEPAARPAPAANGTLAEHHPAVT